MDEVKRRKEAPSIKKEESPKCSKTSRYAATSACHHVTRELERGRCGACVLRDKQPLDLFCCFQ